MTILGIVAVIAIVGLVLLFTGAQTGGVFIGSPGQVQTWGKAIRTVSAERSCILSSGALGSIKTYVELAKAGVPVGACEPYRGIAATEKSYCCPAGVL